MSKNSTGRFLALAIVLALTEMAYKILSGEVFTITLCAMSVAAGVILSLFLAWLVSQMKLQKLHVFVLIWLNLYVVRFFLNMIEGYFFTSVFTSLTDFIIAAFITLGVALVEAAFAGFLLTTGAEDNLSASLKEYLSSRSHGSWIKRIVAGSIVYFPIDRSNLDGGF